MLQIALIAIGNRAWGSDFSTKWIGLALMTVGASLHAQSWFEIVLFATALFLWRNPSSRLWLNLISQNAPWHTALARSSLIMFYGVVKFLTDMNIWHLVMALACVGLVPLAYKLAGKQRRVEPVALAELISGACVGFI